jgi:hypothetical protein
MPSLALHEYRASDTIICSIGITQFSEQEIQRDRGCIFRHYPEAGACGGYRKDGALILQADHLNTRARNISYGDVRLAVCACQRHHIFWKPQHPDQYMRIAREHIGPERSALLDRVIADQTPYRFFLSDWQKLEASLRSMIRESEEAA